MLAVNNVCNGGARAWVFPVSRRVFVCPGFDRWNVVKYVLCDIRTLEKGRFNGRLVWVAAVGGYGYSGFWWVPCWRWGRFLVVVGGLGLVGAGWRVFVVIYRGREG